MVDGKGGICPWREKSTSCYFLGIKSRQYKIFATENFVDSVKAGFHMIAIRSLTHTQYTRTGTIRESTLTIRTIRTNSKSSS